MNLLTYLMLTIVTINVCDCTILLTIVIINVCDCTIWGYYPLGIPAVLTA